MDRGDVFSFLRHQYNWGFHAPFVRGRNPDARYSFLFPAGLWRARALSPFVLGGHFALILWGWRRERPLEVASTWPLIVAGKIAYARGVLAGTRALVTGEGPQIADRR